MNGAGQQDVVEDIAHQGKPRSMGSVTLHRGYISASGQQCAMLSAATDAGEDHMLACRQPDGDWQVQPALAAADSIFVITP